MRITGTFAEAAVNTAATVSAFRITGTFIEVAVRNPPAVTPAAGGWVIGSIPIS